MGELACLQLLVERGADKEERMGEVRPPACVLRAGGDASSPSRCARTLFLACRSRG
jgi:hypothetical protein